MKRIGAIMGVCRKLCRVPPISGARREYERIPAWSDRRPGRIFGQPYCPTGKTRCIRSTSKWPATSQKWPCLAWSRRSPVEATEIGIPGLNVCGGAWERFFRQNKYNNLYKFDKGLEIERRK